VTVDLRQRQGKDSIESVYYHSILLVSARGGSLGLLLCLKVLEDEVEFRGRLTVITDDNQGRLDDLVRLVVLIVTAETSPFAELGTRRHLEQVDVVELA